MPTADPFDRIRLVQARIDPGVLDSFKFNVRTGSWFDEETELESTVLLIGIDDKPSLWSIQILLTDLRASLMVSLFFSIGCHIKILAK